MAQIPFALSSREALTGTSVLDVVIVMSTQGDALSSTQDNLILNSHSESSFRVQVASVYRLSPSHFSLSWGDDAEPNNATLGNASADVTLYATLSASRSSFDVSQCNREASATGKHGA